MYVNCFNRLTFPIEASTKLQKFILDNLRTVNQEGNMETGQMTPFFIYFFHSNSLYHSFLNLQILKIHFHVVPPLVNSSR